MYLAPLNYDRFFKKVFSKKNIAKAFLEDFLDIKIIEIEILKKKNFITDNAIPVEFDYRCKLDNGEHIIIEMQQWYKTDIVKRFYLYHTLSSSLQLENLEEKVVSVDIETGKYIKDKLYNDLKPAITLIWMVDDDLGFKEDFVTYQMGVEDLINFVKDNKLWTKPFEEILSERQRVLELENNETKGLNFLSENKLIFIFQKNIVKNLKKGKKNNIKNKRYAKWFEFAFKTKNKKNRKTDFNDFKTDKTFIDIMHLLLKDRLTQEEIKYITKEEELKLADELKEVLKDVREEFTRNFDKDDVEYISLKEELERLLKKRNIFEATTEEIKENIPLLREIYKKIKALNRANERLSRKYKNDKKFAKIHKNLKNKLTAKEIEIQKRLLALKEKADEMVLNRSDIITQENIFKGELLKDVVNEFSDYNLKYDDFIYIGNLIVKEYVNEYRAS